MSPDIFSLLQSIIHKLLGCLPEQIKPETNFQEDLGADDLECIEIIMATEETFDIEITDQEGEPLITVQALGDFVEAKKAPKQN